MKPQLAGPHARLSVHVPDILHHAKGKHRPNRGSAMPIFSLRTVKLLCIMPTLLHLPGGRIKKRQRIVLAKLGDIILPLLWWMTYTR